MIFKQMIILLFLPLLTFSCTIEQPDTTVTEERILKKEKEGNFSAADNPNDAFKGDLVDLSDYESIHSVDDEHVRRLIRQRNLKESHNTETTNTPGSGEYGNGSSYGRKQPLYVIDGTPIDGTRKASAGKWGDAEYKTAIDIASLEKESVEILSREKAVELYGESGINGAVLITTKNGKKRDISYIRGSGDTTYTREDAASMGMMELINGQKKKKGKN